SALVLRTDMIIDEILVKALVARKGVLLAVPGAAGRRPVAAHVTGDKLDAVAAVVRSETIDEAEVSRIGLIVASAVELAGTHNSALRKKAAPFIVDLSQATA